MAKLSKNAEKNNRKLTDFFVITSSQVTRGSSPFSQPPSSSQPGPSSSQPKPSQRTMSKPSTPAKTSRRVKMERKSSTLPGPDTEIISLSSDSGPIVISSDSKSHISISSSSTSKSKAVVDISNTGSLKQSKSSVEPSQKRSVKNMSTKAKKQPAPPVPVKAESSAAKTTVKRRAVSGVTRRSPPLLNLPKATRPIKRKCYWESSSSSSEEPDGRIFVPKPSSMKPSLTQAPVPQVLARLPSPTANRIPSSPLTSLYSGRSKSSRSSKRIRLDTTGDSTAVSGNDADDEELVPSSQSDEQELTMPKKLAKDPTVVKKSVDKWRRESSVALSPPARKRVSSPPTEIPATPPASSPAEVNWTSDAMSPDPPLPTNTIDEDGDVRMDDGDAETSTGPLSSHPSGDVSHNISEIEVEHQLDALPSASTSTIPQPPSTPPPRQSIPSFFGNLPTDESFFHLFTPSPSNKSSTKPRVVALTVEEKTAKMIEQMKAEAAAAAETKSDSDDEAHLEFKELEESDSDDEMQMVFNFKNKGKGRALAPPAKLPTPARSTHTSPEPTTQRYGLRRRSSPLSTHARLSSPETTRPKPPAKKTANPLDKLLREKKTAEKKGGGIAGMRAAEAVLASAQEKSKNDKGKGKMKAEMDDEESSDEWGDEDAARRIVAQASQGFGASGIRHHQGMDQDDDEDEEGEEFAVDAATRLLEGDEGKKEAVNRILERDRKSWLGKKRAKKVLKGVPLWAEGGIVPVAGARKVPELSLDENLLTRNGTLRFLQGVVASEDGTRLSRCLLPQLFSTMARVDLLSLIPWLTSVVLSSSSELLTNRAMAVITFIARRCAGTPVEVAPLFASSLHALGAKTENLVNLPQNVEIHARCSPLLRGYMLSKLLQVIEAFVQQNTVSSEETPDLITYLLLVGLDPSSLPGLRTEIAVLIDTLTSRIPSSSDGACDMEPLLCARLHKLSSGWSMMNKAFMLSLLRGGSPQIARMTRWLGYCMLLGSEIPDKQKYFTQPSLLPIIKLLIPSTSTEPPTVFDVMKNSDQDDFCEQLSYNIEILEVVLYDIESYVQEEKRNSHGAKATDSVAVSSSPKPGSPEKDRGESDLEIVVELLKKMHGKINDARAGDLERSRVKASLQYCWSRVHYQRSVALKIVSAGRPKNLKGYFPRPIQRLAKQDSVASFTA